MGDICQMGDITSNLNSMAEGGKHAWLASPRVANPALYEELAQPGVMPTIKAAGFRHLVVDLPEFKSPDLVHGQSPQQLAREIAASPTFSNFSLSNNIKAETVAAIMLSAKASGVDLHFTGRSMLEGLDGRQMRSTMVAEYMRKERTNEPPRCFNELAGGPEHCESERRRFIQQSLKDPDSGIVQLVKWIRKDHDKQMGQTATAVAHLPAGERALVIQGHEPLLVERDLPGRLDPGIIRRFDTVPPQEGAVGPQSARRSFTSTLFAGP